MKYKVITQSGSPEIHENIHQMYQYEKIGTNNNAHQRAELQGQPIFKGLVGPMYDEIDGEPCIRYETPEMNNILSK